MVNSIQPCHPPGRKLLMPQGLHEMQALDMSTGWNEALNKALKPASKAPTNAVAVLPPGIRFWGLGFNDAGH